MSNIGDEIANTLGIDNPAAQLELKYVVNDIQFGREAIVILWQDTADAETRGDGPVSNSHLTEIFPGKSADLDAAMRQLAIAAENLLDAAHDASDLGRPSPKSRLPYR